MRDWQFEFSGDWPAGVVILLALAGAVAVWYFYRRRQDALVPWRYRLLLGLRILAVIAVALFLLKPVMRFTHTRNDRQQVIVLQDVSQSMGIRDAVEDKSRLESAALLLRQSPNDLLRRLSKNYKVHFFTFGESASEAPADVDMKPDRKATAIGDALRDSVGRVGPQGLAAVILVSDGVSTTGDEPRKIARGLGVPVYTVLLGGRMTEKGRFVDVGITGAPHNPELIVNNTAKLRLRLSAAGTDSLSPADRQTTLTLKQGDKVVATAPANLGSGGESEAEISYVPRETGLITLTAEIPALPGETILENNTRHFTVNVIDPKIRTLIVEGVARSEYRFLMRVLASDPSIELTGMVKLRKDMFLQQGIAPGVDLSKGLPTRAEDFKRFDVVVLGDIAREEFSDDQLVLLKQFVSDGGALLTLGGYHAYGPGGYSGSPIEDVLPVRLGGKNDGQCDGVFAPRMTAAALADPIFSGCAEFFKSGASQMTLDGANRVAGVKPGSTVLLEHPSATALDAPLPILTAQRYGQGRVLSIMADTTWKWQFQFEGRGLESPYYRFWRQSLRWLVGRNDPVHSGGPALSAWTEKIEYAPGEPVLIQAQLRDEAGQPRQGALTIKVDSPGANSAPTESDRTKGSAAPSGKAASNPSAKAAPAASPDMQLEAVPLSPGRYQVSFRPTAPGVYHAVVHAADAQQKALGDAPLDFIVGHVAGEFDVVDADEQEMTALAHETGGQAHTFATAAHIPEELDQRSRQVVQHEELNLWNAPAFFLIFLGCVTAEWVLRRRSGLN